MSTITKEFTKEQLIAAACSRIDFARQMLRENPLPLAKRKWEIELSLSEIAAASLDAGSAGWQVKRPGGNWVSIKKEDVDHYRFNEELLVREVYTAPLAPVYVPDEMTMQKALSAIDQLSWQECTRDAYMLGWNACRAAMLQGADKELQRKAAIHDALCEKYNVESLAEFVEWQRNHIAELEAAPPAPVGEGKTAVMPDYPGYTLTQRECFQAGKKAGLAEAGKSPVIPDGGEH